MTDDKKPASPAKKWREFWVKQVADGISEGKLYSTCFDQPVLRSIHVIEISALAEAEARIAELETANANCISLSLHESRITALQEKLAVAEADRVQVHKMYVARMDDLNKTRQDNVAANKRIEVLESVARQYQFQKEKQIPALQELLATANKNLNESAIEIGKLCEDTIRLAKERAAAIAEVERLQKYIGDKAVAREALNPSGGK